MAEPQPRQRPLGEAARSALAMLAEGPRPARQFNPGVAGRLVTGGLATMVDLPSPYPTHRRRARVRFVQHLQLTAAGKAELGKAEPGDG